ncbi:MAG: hypothetical protein NTV56_22240 [Alphaproteobacteria bacterium]|nr:hypothetical protein [Alphaproteobacteria bacterium]
MSMLTGPAFCFEMNGEKKDPLTLMYERQDKEKADAEKDYNTQMKRLKQQAPTSAKNDPWSGVRANSDSGAKR